MSNTAEQVIVELLAKVDNFDGKIRQSASSFGGDMKKIETAATKAEAQLDKTAMSAKEFAAALKASGNDLSKIPAQLGNVTKAAANTETALVKIGRSAGAAQQASRNLGFQIGDIGTQLASGTSPFLVLAQQGPQVANALDGASGAVGRMAGFLSSWQGALVLAAASIAAQFLPKLFETHDEIKKLTDDLIDNEHKTEKSEKAQAIFGVTLEGVTKAIRETRKALDEMSDAQNTSAESTLKEAQAQSILVDVLLTGLRARLQIAKADQQVAASSAVQAGLDVNAPGAGGAARQIANDRVKQIDDEIKKANTQLGIVRQTIIEAQSRVTVERASATEEERVNRLYDKRVEDARKLATEQGKVGAQLERQVKALNAARDAELKRIRDANRTGNNRVSGREVTAQEAASIARAAGLQVNSASRTFAQQKALYDRWVAQGMPKDNPVAPPGSSAHEGARGKWALDIQFGQGVTPALLRKVFADQGINLTKVFKERGHFHVEGSRSGADSEDTAAQRAQDDAARNAKLFADESASLDRQLLDEKKRTLINASDITKATLEEIKVVSDKYNADVLAKVQLGDLTGAQAKELLLKHAILSALQAQDAELDEMVRLSEQENADSRRAAKLTDAQIENEKDLLQDRLGLAKTAKDRRDLEKRILDLQLKEEKLHNDAIIAEAERVRKINEQLRAQNKLTPQDVERGKNADEAAGEAQIRNGSMKQRAKTATASIDDSTLSPLAKMLSEIPDSADQINEAFEGIAAHGLESLTDGLADAILGFKSLGDVARGILQMVAQEVIKLVIKMLVLKAIKAIIGGGSGGGSVGSLGHESGHARGGRIGFAPGGLIRGPGTSTSDSIPAITTKGRPILLSDQEYIIKGSSVRKLGVHTLDQINATGVLPTRYAGGGSIGMIQPNNSPATSPWGRDAGPAPAQLFVDARGSVMNDKFAEMILAQSKAFAAKAGREAYNGAVRDTPVIMAKRQRFG